MDGVFNQTVQLSSYDMRELNNALHKQFKFYNIYEYKYKYSISVISNDMKTIFEEKLKLLCLSKN